MKRLGLLGLTLPSPDGCVMPAEHSALIDSWAEAIFDTWRPHRNPKDGGVIIVHRTDEDSARLAWVPYAVFLENTNEGKVPPCNVPAHERTPGLRPGTPPGDVAWVIFIGPDRKIEHVISATWPFDLEAGGDA